MSREIRERRRGISLFYGLSCGGDFTGMARFRFLIIYPPWLGTEAIITVLLLPHFPDVGFCARSGSVHSMDGPGGKTVVIHCVTDMKKRL